MERFKTIVISRPEIFEGEGRMIEALIEEGIDYVHIRKPEASEEEVRRLIETISEEKRERLCVHYHHRAAKETGAGGVHLSGRCREVIKGWTGRVSASCHSLAEAAEMKERCDYVFLSPIYDSISKEGYSSAYSREVLREGVRTGKIDRKVVALGGIDIEKIEEARETGFGGAALLGAIWKDAETEEEIRRRARRVVGKVQ